MRVQFTCATDTHPVGPVCRAHRLAEGEQICAALAHEKRPMGGRERSVRDLCERSEYRRVDLCTRARDGELLREFG